MDIPWKRAIVVGASSGIGEALARKLAARGCRVALVARREDRLKHIAATINGVSLDLAKYYVHDVARVEETDDLFQKIVRDIEGLDLIVYTAGTMPHIDPTEYDTCKDKAVIDTNLTGAIAWFNAAAKRFERARGGTILGIGSVAGDRGRRGYPAYGASKAGLDCYLESLRNRLSRFNVSVVTAKPGPVATEMTATRGKLPGMISVDKASDLILQGAQKFGKIVYIPSKWWLVSRVLRAIPSALFRRMKI